MYDYKKIIILYIILRCSNIMPIFLYYSRKYTVTAATTNLLETIVQVFNISYPLTVNSVITIIIQYIGHNPYHLIIFSFRK